MQSEAGIRRGQGRRLRSASEIVATNAESCALGAKAAVQAWYNLGVASLLVRQYDAAISAFEKAMALNGGKLVGGLLEECGQESAAERARQPKPAPAAPSGPSAQTGILLTNDFLLVFN